MLFQRIEAEGLSHYSYLLGSGHKVVVIDPRRDIDIYLDMAKRNEHQISYVLETHRNEDYLVGSLELANRTGAEIWHADGQLPYQYDQAAEDGQEWELGGNVLRAISTPGHTPGSVSFFVDAPSGAVLFSGDTLFKRGIGRTDLWGGDSGQIMKSLAERLMTLPDDTRVIAGHGPETSIGSERRDNPFLRRLR